MTVPLILLDAGVLWLAVHPKGGSDSLDCGTWMHDLANKGYAFGVAEITDYETRRKLIHQRKEEQLQRLNALIQQMLYLPLTTAIMHRAASLWADVRWRGWATADPKALDADVILGAQWESEHNRGDRPWWRLRTWGISALSAMLANGDRYPESWMQIST